MFLSISSGLGIQRRRSTSSQLSTLHTAHGDQVEAPSSQLQTTNTIQNDAHSFPGKIGINIVHEPQDHNADIIFVHGLGGGSRRSWCHAKDTTLFWPGWLPELEPLQKTRIFTFGYNADVIASADAEKVEKKIETFAIELLHCLRVYGDGETKFGRVGLNIPSCCGP